jgi:hypothetical protein
MTLNFFLLRNRLRSRVLVAVFLFLVGCAGPASRKDANDAIPCETVEHGSLKLTLTVTPKNPRLSEMIVIGIEALADPAVEVSAPEFAVLTDDYSLSVRNYRIEDPKLAGGRMLRRWVYEAEPERSGEIVIHGAVVSFLTTPNVEKKTLTTKPISIMVLAPGNDQLTPDLKNLEQPSGPLSLPDDAWTPYWLLALIAFLLLSGLAALRLARKNALNAPPPLTAEEWANQALSELLRQDLVAKGLVKEFYVRLTGIVRSYIEKTTGLKAPEQTTEEFLEALKDKQAAFPPDQTASLVRFLEAADLVKYAGRKPSAMQIDDAYARAKEFVGFRKQPAQAPANELSNVS